MLLSLYDFKNVCKLKFVCTFCHGSIFKKNFYTVLPYFLSPVNSSFPGLMEILFSLSLYVLNIDLIVFPLFIPNTCGCRIDFFSVFANTALNVDLWLNLVPGAPGVDPSKHMESHWHLTARLASWPERIKKPLKKKKKFCPVPSSNWSTPKQAIHAQGMLWGALGLIGLFPFYQVQKRNKL